LKIILKRKNNNSEKEERRGGGRENGREGYLGFLKDGPTIPDNILVSLLLIGLMSPSATH
jgi:hypothetical protein